MKQAIRGLTCCLGMAFLASAQAVEFPVQGSNAAGRPGDRVFVELTYDYGSSFKAIVEDLALEYQQSGLLFQPQASTIDTSGAPQSLPLYVDSLSTFAQAHQGSVLENTNPVLPQSDRQGYALSFFTADGVGQPRSGLVHLRAVFVILPTAAPGNYQVSFPDRNVLVDEAGTEYFYPAALRNLQVAVVPEPEIVAMMLSGLVLVALRVRRRAPVRV